MYALADCLMRTHVFILPNNTSMNQETLNKELFSSCLSFDCSRMEKALASGADPNVRDNQGDTPILAMMKSRNRPRLGNTRLAALEQLVAAGADVNVLDASGDTPLCVACAHRSPAEVRLLVAAGADVNTPDSEGKSPLSIALGGLRVNVVRMLRNAGGELSPSTESDTFCLQVATGDVSQAEASLQRGVSPDTRTATGIHCLHLAIHALDAEMVELLMRYGADPWALDESRRDTPLIHAVRRGSVEIVRIMRSQPGLKDADASEQARLLEDALRYGHASLARFLVDYGASPDYISPGSGMRLIDYALYRAIQRQLPEMVELAIELGADVNSDGSEIQMISPLHCAADELCCIDENKSAKASCDEPRDPGSDDLSELARRIFHILLEHGADPHKTGKTPMEKIAHLQPAVC